MILPAVAQTAGISVVAPASFARQERIDAGADRLRALGFAPGFMPNAQARGPLFFAGTSEQRVADLHAAFADPESQLVMCLRGGYGSNHLLRQIDPEVIGHIPSHSSRIAISPDFNCIFSTNSDFQHFTGPCSLQTSISKTACISIASTRHSKARVTVLAPGKACAW